MSIKEDLLKNLENIRDILYAPVINILVIGGFLFIAISFFQLDIVNNTKHFHFPSLPVPHLLIIGLASIVIGLLFFYLTNGITLRRVNIAKGLFLRFKHIVINIRIGEIQTISQIDRSVGVVLPANTSFIDDCITDARSALGAFMIKHFPDKITAIQEEIVNQLNVSGYRKDADGVYPQGATIILPDPYKVPVNIIITGATIRKKGVGIRSNPAMLSECIKNIFEITADKKISSIQIPIIGSGHGGIEINFALLSLIFSIWFFSQQFHHLKEFNIIVRKEDEQKFKNLSRYICLTKLE